MLYVVCVVVFAAACDAVLLMLLLVLGLSLCRSRSCAIRLFRNRCGDLPPSDVA